MIEFFNFNSVHHQRDGVQCCKLTDCNVSALNGTSRVETYLRTRGGCSLSTPLYVSVIARVR